MKIEKLQVVVSMLIIITMMALFLVPLWYWALYGMSKEVGDAWLWTNFVFQPLGIAMLFGFQYYKDLKH